MNGDWGTGRLGDWVMGVLYFVKRVPRVRRFSFAELTFLFGGMTG